MRPPYDITNKVLTLYGQIAEAIGVCKSLLLLKPEARLRKQNRIRTIHSSLAIEGNTLDIAQVSALLENARVVGPKTDILEVQNAIKAYDQLSKFKPYSVKDFLKAHKIFMDGLLDSAGQFRRKQVGIMNGSIVKHVAPSHAMVPDQMHDLFAYIKHDPDNTIIKSCVFHYEMEFIHPFEDGNGRMGRFWQTRLLMELNPIFEYVPIEATIKSNQELYYKSLADADNSGKSTIFIEFMLDAIDRSLRATIDESNIGNIDFQKRADAALLVLDGWFDRKDYMKIHKGISSATASRDLKRMLEAGSIESTGTGRMTRYKKKV